MYCIEESTCCDIFGTFWRPHQARNQLGTPGVAKSFLRGPNFSNYVQ